MKLLSVAKSIRFTAEQDRWLMRQALQQGHCSQALIIRMLIDKAMHKGAR